MAPGRTLAGPMPKLLLLLPALTLGCAADHNERVVDVAGSGPAWNCKARVELSSLWEALRARYDADGDGRIPREDYPRGDVRFANFDRTEDGVLSAADFPTDRHFNGFSHFMLGQADADSDGSVTKDEWWLFCSEWDSNGDDVVVSEEVEEFLGPWVEDWTLFLLSFDQDADGDFDRYDMHLTFADQDYDGDGKLAGKELSGWQSPVAREEGDAPEVGSEAPGFTLGHAGEPERSFSLESALAEQPVALLFGSYT